MTETDLSSLLAVTPSVDGTNSSAVDDTAAMSFGKRVKEVRLALGLYVIRKVAHKAGVTENYWTKVENEFNDNPKYESICAIAKGLGIPPAVLMESEGTALPQEISARLRNPLHADVSRGDTRVSPKPPSSESPYAAVDRPVSQSRDVVDPFALTVLELKTLLLTTHEELVHAIDSAADRVVRACRETATARVAATKRGKGAARVVRKVG